ncbi:MAG: Asp-tRNA(Asn)/Glu-tRNA(Gln) amidotransferase subunit GatC [bacterium]|nr:Asp-tRNA(Asn)/Glu-tRNA(Gln) amidotransferase subunit GatC [bacterium]
MINRQDIDKLATLSRLKLSDEEKAVMEKDMVNILAYVDTLKSAPTGGASGPIMTDNRNVMREDANPNEGGKNTKKLVSLAPKSQGDLVKVKKILGGTQ